MMKRNLALAVLIAALAIPSLAPAKDRRDRSDNKHWIHVEVLEEGEDGASVKVNLPLSMARMALDMAPEDVLSEGHLQIEEADLSMDELRELWAELRDAGEAEFVTIKEDDESVRVFRKGDMLYVHVDEDDGDEHVRIQIPMALVDALLSGKGEELNIEAALAELEKLDGGEIVRVEDGGDLVRVWID